MVGWIIRLVLTILPDELNDKEPPPTLPSRRPADLLCQVCLDLLSDNAAAGRQAEEMLKTWCQCVSASVTPGHVRNVSSFPMLLIRPI